MRSKILMSLVLKFFSALRHERESEKIKKDFSSDFSIIFKANLRAVASAVKMEAQPFNLSWDEAAVEKAAAPTQPKSLEPSVKMCFLFVYLFNVFV